MPFCSNCGKEVARGVKFCPECGAPLSWSQSTETQAPPAAPQARVRRPRGPPKPRSFLLLVILDVIVGVFIAFLGLLALSAGGAGVAAVGVYFVGVGLLSLLVAWGYARGSTWQRKLGVPQGFLLLLVGIVFAISGTLAGLAYGIPELVVGVWTLYALTRGKLGFAAAQSPP